MGFIDQRLDIPLLNQQNPSAITYPFGEVKAGVRQQAILVLGMHRSGTSAFTRVLGLNGAALPKRRLDPGPYNTAGYWESRDIVVLHEEILVSAGSTWSDFDEFPQRWFTSPESLIFRRRLVTLLRTEFAGAAQFVVKDPRACRLVPFWLSALNTLGAAPHVVIPFRNPLEVAASLKRRDGLPAAMALLLWLRHFLAAERDTRGIKRSFVAYDGLLTDWRGTIGKLNSDMGLGWAEPTAKTAGEIEAFLSKAMRHHAFDVEEVCLNRHVTSWVKIAYDWVIRASEGIPALPVELDTIRVAFDAACVAFTPLMEKTRADDASTGDPALRDITTLRDRDSTSLATDLARLEDQVESGDREIARLKRELGAITHSTCWRATAPLRGIGERLKQLRRP